MASGYSDIINSQPSQLNCCIAAQIEAQLHILAQVISNIGGAPSPTGTFGNGNGWIAYGIVHGGIQPLPQAAWRSPTYQLHIHKSPIKGGTLYMVTLAPGDPGCPSITSQVNIGGEQILIAAGVVGVVQVCDPTVAAAVAGCEGVKRGQSPFPLVLDTGMGEPAIIGFKVAGVNDLGG